MSSQLVNNWLNIIQDYAFPPTCILCASPGYKRWDICYDCYLELPGNFPCCPHCAVSLPESQQNLLNCGNCQTHPPAFDKTFAFFKHQHSLRYLISELKFHKRYKIARLLGSLLAAELEQLPELPEAIIPVPLHISRFRERGFNQSQEISQTVSKLLKIPLLNHACIRQRNTPHQTDLTRSQRLNNMRNAFSLNKPIQASHVAILDDVMTTGSTLNEMAKTLKTSGVRRVDAWVIARA